MIPKVIHYCWFGGNEIPEKDKMCIESWKKYCPDYEIIQWNETNYDINKNQYMSEAYKAKKWGFVPDYARLDIIMNYGGIYLDTDVEIIKNLDPLLTNEAFMGFESCLAVANGLGFGAIPGHPVIEKLLHEYDTRHFICDDGTFDLTTSPTICTNALLNYGLILNGKEQIIEGVRIYPDRFFCPLNYETGILNIQNETYTIHWYNASWQSKYKKIVTKINRKTIDLFGNRAGKKYGRILAFPFSILAKVNEIGLKKSFNYAKVRIMGGKK